MNNRNYSSGWRGIFPAQNNENSPICFYDRTETTPRNIVFLVNWEQMSKLQPNHKKQVSAEETHMESI